MREIKFRAWHETHNPEHPGRMLTVDYLEWPSRFDKGLIKSEGVGTAENDNYYAWDEIVLMQFTGLKDKNGTEIYEGDIVKYTRYNWELPGHRSNHTDLVQICEVYWSEEHHSFREQGEFASGGGWSSYLIFNDPRADRNEIELIGNIYENPELLRRVNNDRY